MALCSTRFLLLLLLLSAVPCAKWDDLNRRFIVSYIEGGVGVVPLNGDASILEEITVVGDAGFGNNSSLGIVIDRPRNRLLVAIADVQGNKYSAIAAYDLTTWNQLYHTKLAGPEGEKTFADDVAVDMEGNAYVTDVKGSKLWKVGVIGELLYTIKSPLFIPKECSCEIVRLRNFFLNILQLHGLNGIVYHPNGYLLVVHTLRCKLFKAEIGKGDVVKEVNIIGGSLMFGDGLELISPTKIAVAGNAIRLVERLPVL
ncbi:hypothetical protein SASPL_100909 [Salvia splendens]|uniref:Strictosidine synthase n=1 Tax=Salvia splendens TaxID=180675 RepID=A0A8X8YN95_SALSN|nr:hypothetical protein SASPL_100909 [Salvia splendens]